MIKKKKAGRPPKIDDSTLANLKMAFMGGLSDEEACLVADINPSTLYRYQESNPDFASKKEMWKSNLRAQAKYNIAERIMKKRDTGVSIWYLERRDPDFSKKVDSNVKGEINVNNPYSDLTEEELRKLADE